VDAFSSYAPRELVMRQVHTAFCARRKLVCFQRRKELAGELDITYVKDTVKHELTPVLLHVSPHFPFLRTMSKGTVPNILTFFPRSNMVAQLCKKQNIYITCFKIEHT
jgi:hypothetical protein